MRTWDKDSIKVLIETRPLAVERAMMAIYKRQTASEQNCHETIVHNGIGFSGAHARMGSYYAEWCLSGKHLTGKHLDKARKIALRYTGQLLNIAQGG